MFIRLFFTFLFFSLSVNAEDINLVLNKITTSQQLINGDKITFQDLTDFIEKNSYWPQLNLLFKKVEHSIMENDSPEKILNWFNKYKPVTEKGYQHYILSANKLNDIKLKKILKYAWINSCFNIKDQEVFLIKYKNYLTLKDHIARIDKLLWQDNTLLAKNLLYLVDNNYKKIFKTRIALIDKERFAIKMFNKLPIKNKTDSGLVFSYLNFYRKELPTRTAFKIMSQVNTSNYADKWINLRILYSRELLKKSNFNPKLAYAIIAKHNTGIHKEIVEAEWLCGWIALRFLNKPELAIKHFNIAYQNSTIATSISKCNYWLGRSYKALKQNEKADSFFSRAGNYSWTFYGQLSLLEMQKGNIPVQSFDYFIEKDSNNKKEYTKEHKDLITAVTILVNNNYPLDLICTFIDHAMKHNSKEDMLALFKDVKKSSLYLSVWMSKMIQNHGLFLIESYPKPYILPNIVDNSLVYAIIRQESSFNPNAYDPKHQDSGLMQLIPETAQKTAKKLKISFDKERLLTDTNYNITLGTAHLKELLEYYTVNNEKDKYYGIGNILAIAAYNAGVSRVDKWIATYHSPRHLKSVNKLYKIIDFIELIPFSGTRKYVQRVLETLQVYRAIYGKNFFNNFKLDLGYNG